MRVARTAVAVAVLALVLGALAGAADAGAPPAAPAAAEARGQARGAADAPGERPLGVPRWNVTREPQVGLGEALRGAGGPAKAWLWALVPDQGGVLWIAILVTLMVAFDWGRPLRGRNLDVLALLAVALPLVEIRSWTARLADPVGFTQFALVFRAIFLISLALLVRAVVGSRRPAAPLRPNLGRRALLGLAVLTFTLDVGVGLARKPDDAGYFIGLGAQRLRETGRFPYRDPFLREGAAAAYGPVSYLAHLPFQLVLDPTPRNAPEPLPRNRDYVRPPLLATKLCVVALHALGVVALYLAGRRLAGAAVALALVALYCGSAYVLGVGGERLSMGGMTYVSHIGPAALTLAAFAALPVPWLAGALLALAAGFLFYPVFFVPAWLGWYVWRREGWLAFSLGLALTGAAVGGVTLALTDWDADETALGGFLSQTLGHQTDRNLDAAGGSGYGDSPFGFWGTHPRLRAVFQAPLVGGSSLTQPAFLLLALFVAAGFLLARGRSAAQLALLTAALALAVQLWKPHAGGTYVTWYYPFLLIGLFAGTGGDRGPAAQEARA